MPTNISVNGGLSNSESSDFAIKCIYVYNRILTTSEIQQVEQFITQRNSLTDPTKIGNTGGLEYHRLTTNEMPAHNHTGGTTVNGNHNHPVGWIRGNENGSNDYTLAKSPNTATNPASTQHFSDTAGNHSHAIPSDGGSLVHNNMPPYYVLAYIMKL
jgi:microcystin-dependent protein